MGHVREAAFALLTGAGGRTVVTVEQRVLLIEERQLDPSRPGVVHQGAWWRGSRRAWRLCDGDRGWMADICWTRQHDGEPRTYDKTGPADRVWAADAPGAP
jgi:hypothetical protein